MTLEEFNKLDHETKLFEIVDNGTFVDNYITTEIKINCYSLHKFFVEFVYNGDENRISEIRTFEDGVELDKYIY